jgi:hypothetical protein
MSDDESLNTEFLRVQARLADIERHLLRVHGCPGVGACTAREDSR